MAHLNTNTFSSYALTEEEVLAGSVYTIAQLQVLQNILADIAEEKMALEIDPANFNSYLQREADLAGRLKILQYLIETSEAIVATRRDFSANSDNS